MFQVHVVLTVNQSNTFQLTTLSFHAITTVQLILTLYTFELNTLSLENIYTKSTVLSAHSANLFHVIHAQFSIYKIALVDNQLIKLPLTTHLLQAVKNQSLLAYCEALYINVFHEA